jgi:Regulator of G protein signaling domain/Domain of unknown function (DUF4157)
MKHQHLSQTKNAIASSNRENAIARSSTHPIEELQGAIGNRAVNQLLAKQPIVQTKPMFRGLSHEFRSNLTQINQPIQAKEADSASVKETHAENKTGLPDNLKVGIENLSGIAMDDVRVHYNSSQPSQLQALAYTQGTDIHVAPGQETHLPHEAWHVVQQAQGRVKPTIQAKGVGINDDESLEKEADVMGTKAAQGEQERVVGLGQGVQRKTADNVGDVVQCWGWKDLTYKIGRKTGLSLGTAGGKQGAKDRKAHRSTRNPPQVINFNNTQNQSSVVIPNRLFDNGEQLEDPTLFKLFLDFCKQKDKSSENPLFWKDVTEFEQNPSPEKAQQIFNTYVTSNSPNRVTIDNSEIVNQIQTDIDSNNITKDIFANAKTEVIGMMKDTWRRFYEAKNS